MPEIISYKCLKGNVVFNSVENDLSNYFKIVNDQNI